MLGVATSVEISAAARPRTTAAFFIRTRAAPFIVFLLVEEGMLNRQDTDTFVGMYVNQLTLDYGTRGRAGLQRFFDEAFEKKLIPKKVDVEFV